VKEELEKDVSVWLRAYVCGFAVFAGHGDAIHRQWLKDAAEAYADGRLAPPVRGGDENG